MTGYLFTRGVQGAEGAPGDHIGIGGTHSNTGRIFIFNGNLPATRSQPETPRWLQEVGITS